MKKKGKNVPKIVQSFHLCVDQQLTTETQIKMCVCNLLVRSKLRLKIEGGKKLW